MPAFFCKMYTNGGPLNPCYHVLLQANTCPLYLTLTGFDQNQELVHFGKLTPPQNGRIPEMQMPVFLHIFMFQHQREKIWVVGFTLAPLPYTHFDQNQELGHFGKLTPAQRGQIPEMPIAACFGAEKFSPENFFQQHFLAENGPHVLVTGLIFSKI